MPIRAFLLAFLIAAHKLSSVHYFFWCWDQPMHYPDVDVFVSAHGRESNMRDLIL
jgi:hypothetical protein